ncbi:MAG TPA: immunoglobulin domain-containing protein [Verrucomicrobiae bacterium]|nr:immunoglobulin domain-containing protein [Verrucomicrobiae bacterium]
MRITWVLALAALLPAAALADAVLNECSQPALETALAAGGRITVNCDGTLLISNTVSVTTNAYVDATGHRVTISSLGGTNAVRLFTVNTGASFSLINFMLAGGRSTNGGAIYNNRGFLTLENCVLSNHLAMGASGGTGGRGGDSDFQSGGKGRSGGNGRSAFGGAIYNLHGTTIVNRCSFLTNAATAGDGGAGGAGGNGAARGGDGGNGGSGSKAQGGAIFNSGLLIVSNSAFLLNGATGGAGGTGGSNGTGFAASYLGHGGAGGSAAGGAIFNTNRGRAFVYGSTFALNGALSGDSANAGSESPRARTGKQGANSLGGAVANYGTNVFLNCTFFANRTTGGAAGNGAASDVKGGKGGDGGSAYGGNLYSAKWTAVTNCTFFDGGTTGGTNGLGGAAIISGKSGKRGARRGGNVSSGGGFFILKNSLIAFASRPGTNGYGTFKDAGYNLSSDRSIKLRGPGSMTNTDPVIGILGRNGGLTETVPLFTGSPAIDAGDTNFCLVSDQRGVPRPYDSRCDIGAYEFGLTLLPPTISSQPQSQTAQPGATVSFIVVARGDPPITYQWRRGSVNITNATGPVLTLSNVQSTNAATYTVVIANNSGTITSSGATLSLISPVAITQQPTSTTVFSGSNATFNVTATGAAPLFYQWYFNGALIPGATLSTFMVVNAQETNDAGNYHVIVYNSFSSATSAVAILTVGMLPPTIETEPESQTIESGETAMLSVIANGSQPLSFQWYRDDTNLVPGATSDTLTISNAQPVHSGNYTVIVTNSLGSATSSVAVLTVTVVAPRITSQPADQTPCVGDTVVFRVAARGTEPITYQWLRDDVSLPNETNAILVIANVQPTNAATYKVVVTNDIGMVTSDPAVLMFTSFPNITQQPQDIVVFVGSNAVFTVRNCPTPGPFAYQWCFESAETGDVVEIAGATNAMLTVSTVDFDDAGFYTVIITNLVGKTVSEAAELSVSVPFTSTRITSAPLVYEITFDTDDDGLTYSLQRQEPTDPHNWEILQEYIGDGNAIPPHVDNVPEEITTPVYRVVRRAQ